MHTTTKIILVKFLLMLSVPLLVAIPWILRAYPLLTLLAIPVFLLYFLRDPERDIADGIVSPADGVVTNAEYIADGMFISIFMNVHDVHVNRAPADCRVVAISRFPGAHRAAFGNTDKNEKVVYRLVSSNGIEIILEEVSGIFARRIIPFVRVDQIMKKGDKIGMIIFGSRVNLMIKSKNVKIYANRGDRVYSGSSKIGEFIKEGAE